MEKKYILKGLDCPHCSSEIENAVRKLKEIKSANVNLINQTLTVECSIADLDTLFSKIEKTVHKFEPDVKVIEQNKSKTTTEEENHSHTEHRHSEEHSEHSHNHEHCSCDHEHNHGEERSEHSHNHEHCCCEYEHKHTQNERDFQKGIKGDVALTSCKELKFELKGLDCPNCAAEIERQISKLYGVTSADINLVSEQLSVKISNMYSGNLLADVENIVHTLEPDVKVSEKNSSKDKAKTDSKRSKEKFDRNSDKIKITRFSVGALIYAAGLIIPLVFNSASSIGIALLIISYIILGFDVIWKAVKNILRGRVFDENFLMTISTVGAFVIGEYPEAVAVMLFYQIGEFFQSLAVNHSRKSISALMDIRPDSANVKRNGKIITVSPEDVSVGETIVIKPGEKIPLDGIITDGEAMLDTRALTGESVPRSVKCGDTALSGCINENGVISLKVTKEFGESTASKIIDMVENAAGRKAPAENFITEFAKYYTPIVVILAVLLAIIPPFALNMPWSESIRRGFVFLVISCPCALVISIPLTFFGGIGAASRKGILIKGSNYLEALGKIDTIVFDKTGTLTKGVFKVTNIEPANGFDSTAILEYAAKAEAMSNHPIARSIVSAYGKAINENEIKDYSEISGQGITAQIGAHRISAGNDKLMKSKGITVKSDVYEGTVVHIAIDEKYGGSILISDEIKEDSAEAIKDLKSLGITKCVMLTGDNEAIAKSVAEKIGIDEYHSELLPAQKVEQLELIDSKKSTKGKLAFVGDGINDAPVLARADIGIAMGALGSDAAIEAADVVLMTDEPSKLAQAVKTANATKKIVMQNIMIVLIIKVLFLILGAFGIAGMWEAVFGDVGVMIIAVINSMRILRK